MIKNVGHLCLIQYKLSALLVTAELVEHVDNLHEFWSNIILNLVYYVTFSMPKFLARTKSVISFSIIFPLAQ